MKASVMLEKRKDFATILPFNVEVLSEFGVKSYIAVAIWQVFDQFKA